MGDPYYSVLKKVENSLLQLSRDVEERNSTQGPLSKKDTVIRNQIKNVQGMIDDLLSQVKSNESENSYNLNALELGKRRKIAFELQNKFKDIQTKFTSFNPKNKGDDFEHRSNYNEKRDFDRMDANEAKLATKELRNEQEELIDLIGDTVSNIKTGQITMKNELDYQNQKLLPDIEIGVDKNQNKVNKSNSAVLKLLESKSNCSLYIIIAAEVALLVFQLIILP